MKAREFDAFGDRWKNLLSLDERCERCGIEVVRHTAGGGIGLDDRLFKCRECGAVLCSWQVHFSKPPLDAEEIGSHQVYSRLEKSKFFIVAVNKQTDEEAKVELAHMAVFCGFVDVVEQKSGDTGATRTEAENQSGPS